jgi:ankyrin repeat protein
MIKLLAERGADVNARSQGGQTALIKYAATASCLPGFTALLEAGADPTLKGDAGETAMKRAEMTRSREMFSTIENAVQQWNAQKPTTEP